MLFDYHMPTGVVAKVGVGASGKHARVSHTGAGDAVQHQSKASCPPPSTSLPISSFDLNSFFQPQHQLNQSINQSINQLITTNPIYILQPTTAIMPTVIDRAMNNRVRLLPSSTNRQHD